jgi:hypothetical protein
MTWHRKPRLSVGRRAVDKANLKTVFRRGKGKRLQTTTEETTPKLRGYFRHAEVKGIFEELDGWLRRKLRRILWKQWKRPYTSQEPDAAGITGGNGREVCHKRPRPLLERRGRAHAQGFSEILLRHTGAGVSHGPAPPTFITFSLAKNGRAAKGVSGRAIWRSCSLFFHAAAVHD